MGLEPASPTCRAGLFLGLGSVANLNSFSECVGRIVENTSPKESGDWSS